MTIWSYTFANPKILESRILVNIWTYLDPKEKNSLQIRVWRK